MLRSSREARTLRGRRYRAAQTPKTGDDSYLLPLIALMLVSGGLLVAIKIKMRKEKTS